MYHLSDAWARRERDNVFLVHYADLTRDLAATIRDLAAFLDITTPELTWSAIADAAAFERMSADSATWAPDPRGILRSRAAFFRRGDVGEGWAALGPDPRARYVERVQRLGPPDLVEWLHRPMP
jgi:hypothetical protein